MDLPTRLKRLMLRLHPDPQVREAARERDRRARERARYPEFMRMVSEDLKARALLAARLQAQEEQTRAKIPVRPGAAPGERTARLEEAREKSPDALLVSTWSALKSAAEAGGHEQVFRRRAEVLALAGVRPESVTAPAVAGDVVEAAFAEVESGRVHSGVRCAGLDRVPPPRTVVVTASALDAVAATQLVPDADAACIAIGARPTGRTVRDVRRALAEAQNRLQAERPGESLAVKLAFGRREELLAELVRAVVPENAEVTRHLSLDGESWSARLARLEHDQIVRARVRAGARAHRGRSL